MNNYQLKINNYQLPEGYKQTEVGVIPEDWEVANAEQVCELVVDCKNRTPPFIDSSDFAVVRTPNVRNGRFVYEDLRFTDEESFHKWTTRAVPKAGDILITREAPLGEVCLVPTELKVCLGQRMMLYRSDLAKADNSFFLYSLMAPAVQSCLLKKIGGSTVGHAKVNDIRTLEVPLPPLPEQRSIAKALSDVDALIAALDKLIAKKRHLKTATMQQLLTGKKRLPGFGEGKGYKKTEIGTIPEDWKVIKLRDVLKIKHGRSQCKIVDSNGIYPVLATGGEIGRTNTSLYSKPSVLIGRKGTIDTPKYIDSPFWTVDTLFYSEISKNTDVKFVFYKFNLIDWYSYNEASGVPSLNAATIENINQVFPHVKEEQYAIATVLSDMDAEIAALETRLAKTQSIKQGMMQELLTGRVRLV